MPTLYIHMGTPKTATTSIQMFCVENQERFREEGYSYPYWILSIRMCSSGETDIFWSDACTNRINRRYRAGRGNMGKRSCHDSSKNLKSTRM